MSITTGTVAFINLDTTEVFNGQDTGKYTVTVTLSDDEASSLSEAGVKLREYEGQPQRKFSSKYPVKVVDVEDNPYKGPIGRGSIIRLLWKEGKPHPVHGTPTYLNAVRVLELADNMEVGDEEF